MSARLLAYRSIERLERSNGFIKPLSTDAADREIVHAHVIGTVRWRGQLDYFIEKFAERPVSKLDEATLRVLRLAIHELRFMRSAQHAVVSEWVTIATRFSKRSTGLVNAVLRRATRESLDALLPKGDSISALAVRHSHPEWMVRRWVDRFGEAETIEILKENQKQSSPDILVDTRRISVDEVVEMLERQEIGFERSLLRPDMLRLSGSTTPLVELIQKGWVHPLDEGSAAVAFAVPASETIIDLAAAPGGKSLILSMRGARVVSCDISFARARTLKEIVNRGERAGPVVVADGRMPPFRRCESVLLDAPCSATGTLRKNPEAKWRLEENDLDGFATLQIALLKAALSIAERFCVYSTCSLEREENTTVVDAALAAFPEFIRSTRFDRAVMGKLRGEALFFSPASGTDGFFVHLLERKSQQ